MRREQRLINALTAKGCTVAAKDGRLTIRGPLGSFSGDDYRAAMIVRDVLLALLSGNTDTLPEGQRP